MKGFNQAYFDSGVWEDTWYTPTSSGLPVNVFKYPTDLWVYHEIISEVKPAWIVETGGGRGGSAAWFADHSNARVVSVDLNPDRREVEVPGVTYVAGDSADPLIFNRVRDLIPAEDSVLVCLDSEHLAAHVTAELALWPSLVSRGSYLVVEDTFIDLFERAGQRFGDGGPWVALEPWLETHPEFQVDRSREKFFLTMNPQGWLRRVS
jgi:cephalosporin hydroxylase